MAFGGLKRRYSDTNAFVLVKHTNSLIVCSFLSSFFPIYYDTLSPGEIDAILACAEKRHTILRCPISAGVRSLLIDQYRKYSVFRNFLIHTLVYYIGLKFCICTCTTEHVKVSSHCVNCFSSYASF